MNILDGIDLAEIEERDAQESLRSYQLRIESGQSSSAETLSHKRAAVELAALRLKGLRSRFAQEQSAGKAAAKLHAAKTAMALVTTARVDAESKAFALLAEAIQVLATQYENQNVQLATAISLAVNSGLNHAEQESVNRWSPTSGDPVHLIGNRGLLIDRESVLHVYDPEEAARQRLHEVLDGPIAPSTDLPYLITAESPAKVSKRDAALVKTLFSRVCEYGNVAAAVEDWTSESWASVPEAPTLLLRILSASVNGDGEITARVTVTGHGAFAPHELRVKDVEDSLVPLGDPGTGPALGDRVIISRYRCLQAVGTTATFEIVGVIPEAISERSSNVASEVHRALRDALLSQPSRLGPTAQHLIVGADLEVSAAMANDGHSFSIGAQTWLRPISHPSTGQPLANGQVKVMRQDLVFFALNVWAHKLTIPGVGVLGSVELINDAVVVSIEGDAPKA